MAHAAHPLDECRFTFQHVKAVITIAWDRHGNCSRGDGEVGELDFGDVWRIFKALKEACQGWI